MTKKQITEIAFKYGVELRYSGKERNFYVANSASIVGINYLKSENDVHDFLTALDEPF